MKTNDPRANFVNRGRLAIPNRIGVEFFYFFFASIYRPINRHHLRQFNTQGRGRRGKNEAPLSYLKSLWQLPINDHRHSDKRMVDRVTGNYLFFFKNVLMVFRDQFPLLPMVFSGYLVLQNVFFNSSSHPNTHC